MLAPIWQAVRAMRRGRFPLDLWRSTAAALLAGGGRPVGPVSAALKNMRALRLGGGRTCWTGVPRAPHGWRPGDVPAKASLEVLLDAWRASQWREVAARRDDFPHLVGGVDRWASGRLLASGRLAADAAGALRTVMCGNVITEQVAAHWTGRPLCPHCRSIDVEDREHRFWQCPAWDAARASALGSAEAARRLRGRLDTNVARTGVLATDPQLEALAIAAAVEDPQLPPPGHLPASELPRTVWTDGSCVIPQDPLPSYALQHGPQVL